MPVAVKLIGFVLVAVFSADVLLIAWIGRTLHQDRKTNPGRNSHLIHAHRACVDFLITLTVVMVVSVEGFVRFYGSAPYPWYFWSIHLPADIVWAVLLITTRFFFNGDERPDVHRYFAYPTLLLSAVVATTGGLMFYNA